LYEKLEQTRTALAPKSKFTFKSSVKKNSSAISLTDAAELAKQQGPPLLSPRGVEASSGESSANQTPSSPSSPQPDVATATRPEPHRRGSLGSFLKAAGVESTSSVKNEPSSAVRKMSFASSNSVHISSHSGVHIILPSSAAHATSSGSLINLRHCIVDMSTPTATGQPFAALTIKDVKRSLLICGHVSGAAHITNVRDSVIRVYANQVRMHDCKNCIVYLFVRSRPVIENCSEIYFAAPPQPSVRALAFT
jgi:tubulin-specific chaperone C